MTKLAAVIVAAVFVIGGCGSSGPGSIDDAAKDVDGCESPTPETVDADDRDINGIVAQVTCADGRTVYQFDTTTHRNVYVQLGEAVGGVYDKVGDKYLIEK
jgi:predicted small lipoprotein YifL